MEAQIVTIVAAVLACGGFWTFVQYLITRKDGKRDITKTLDKLQRTVDSLNDKSSKQIEGITALSQERILSLCRKYEADEEVSIKDFAALERMANAYYALGGNGEVKEAMEIVNDLPHTFKGGGDR